MYNIVGQFLCWCDYDTDGSFPGRKSSGVCVQMCIVFEENKGRNSKVVECRVNNEGTGDTVLIRPNPRALWGVTHFHHLFAASTANVMRDEECDGFGASAVDPNRDPSSVSSLKKGMYFVLLHKNKQLI